MIVLRLESFKNNLFELDFLTSKKNVFLQSNLVRKVSFLHGYDIFFSRDSCSFPYIKILLKVSDYIVEKNPTSVNNLKYEVSLKEE